MHLAALAIALPRSIYPKYTIPTPRIRPSNLKPTASAAKSPSRARTVLPRLPWKNSATGLSYPATSSTRRSPRSLLACPAQHGKGGWGGGHSPRTRMNSTPSPSRRTLSNSDDGMEMDNAPNVLLPAILSMRQDQNLHQNLHGHEIGGCSSPFVRCSVSTI